MKTLYLAGAINGRTDDECHQWRQFVKAQWAWRTLDPMDRDYRGREDGNAATIVEADKAAIDACDIVLVYYDRPSVGTAMEILYAWERGKPVYIVAHDAVLSPWLRYHATRVVQTLDQALRLLQHEAVA